MTKIWAIANRDFRSALSSFIFWVATALFLLLAGYFFYNILWYSREAQLRNTLNNMGITLIFTIPIVTMRSLAEERKNGTIELLATSPVTSTQIVLGKFLGVFLFFAFMMSFTFAYPIILEAVGNPDLQATAVGYLGFLLLGGALLSFGLFASSVTENQIIAAMISFAGLLFLWISDWISGSVGPLGPIFTYLSFLTHFQNFAKGVIDVVDAFYYLSFIGLFLYLTKLMVDARR